MASNWSPKRLRVVAFAQEPKSRAIVAAATWTVGD
jgi:hypothetical protein